MLTEKATHHGLTAQGLRCITLIIITAVLLFSIGHVFAANRSVQSGVRAAVGADPVSTPKALGQVALLHV